MKILFDSAFDGRAWPQYPNGQKACLGAIQVGEAGMLDILETMLGLRGPTVPEAVRTVALVPYVQKNKTAFWAKSAVVDPFGSGATASSYP